jgi:hypothetical protein
LKARLSEMGLRSEAAQVDEERIVRAAMVLQRVMPVICDRLWLGRRPRDRKGAPDPTNRHLQATKEGAVDPLEDRASFDPVAFLVGLAQHQAIPGSREDQFKRSVAAILTLWSWYHLKLGEERGSQMIRGR